MSDATDQGVMSASGPSAPLACSLTGADLRQRSDEVGELFQHVAQVRELPDGYAFTFPGGDEWIHLVMDFIVAERACCPFFTFEVASVAPHQALSLVVRGGEGVKQMVVPFVEKSGARASAAD